MAEIPAVIRRARDELARLCAGRGRMTESGLAGREWRMCIPAHPDDSDTVFADLIEAAAGWEREAALLRREREELRVALRAIGPHYYLVDAAAAKERKRGRREVAERLEYVFGRLCWMDHRLGTMTERVDEAAANRNATATQPENTNAPREGGASEVHTTTGVTA